MSILKEFKSFAVKGNVVDLAVGVIIGGAFGKIVTSVVNDIIMPLVGVLVGGVNFSELKWVLKEAVGEKPALSLNYGNFIQVTFDFLIVAFSIFMVIKAINAAKKKEKDAASEPLPVEKPSKQEELLTEIRDLLKK
jgi:large conductance mechanosensitive channel